MRKLKKFTSSLLMLAVVMALAVGNAGCTAKTRKIYHEKRADKFYAAGEFDRAEIEYLNVLHNDRADARAMGRLGLIYYQEGRAQAAFPYLRRGSELATNDLDLRLKLGFVYVAMGRTGDAREAAEFVLARKPQDEEAPLLLVETVSTPKEIAAAQARLQKLAGAGDSASIEVALGGLAFRQQDLKSAAANYQRALSLDPKFSVAWAALANLYGLENDVTNAEASFQKAAELAPDRSPIKVQYARFKIIHNDAVGARQILEEMVKRTPDYIPAWMELAEIDLIEKKFDACQAALGRVLDRDRDNYDARMMDSRLKLAQNNLPGAITELERMTQMYTQSPRAYYQLGQAYLMNSDFDKATANLRHALNLDPNFAEAVVLLAQIQIQNRNVNAAIPELENLVRRQPEQVEAQLLLAAAYRQNRQFNDAMAIYHSLEKSFPKNSQVPLLIGSAYAQQNNLAEARREFDRALTMTPDSLPALEQMVDLDLSEKQYAAAGQLVQSRLQADPKQLQLYLLLANVFSVQGQDDQAVAILQKGLIVFPDNPTISLFLAQTYFHANQNDKSLALLDRVLAQDPKNLSALMLKATVFGLNKDYDKQAGMYEQMLEIDPNYSLALNNLADVYAEHLHRLDRAYDLAQHVHELLPFDPAVADTLGWISFLRGSYPSALGLIQGSAAQLPNDPEVQFHLGLVNYMSGNEAAARAAFQRALQINNGSEFSGREECKTCLAILAINPRSADAAALATLEKRIADKPGDPVALGRLAAVYQYQGNSDKAITSYEAILQIAPNNLMATLNLAQLYATRDLAKAYGFAKAADGLAPENPVAVHIYGRLAYQSGDFKLANALLQQALRSQTDDPQAYYDFGLSAYSLGKISDARTALQDALQINLPAPQSTEATRLLDLINLAADPAQAAAAAAHVSEILKSEPDYVPALMALGVIDEHNGDGSSAALAYEKILTRYPDFSPAQRQLAILYSRNLARLSEAYDLATKARKVYPDDVNLAKATGIILFLQNNYSGAASLLKGTAALLPADPEVFYYLGIAQLKLNENREGKASLQAALNLKLSGQLADSARQMLAQLK